MMPHPIVVAGSDNHIEYCAYTGYPQMCGDSYHAIRQEVDYAIHYGVPLVLAGDPFDKHYPDSYSLKRVFLEMDRLHEHRIPCYYIQGQHELSRRQPWMGLHSWPTHLHRELVVVGGGHCLYGLDFQPPAHLAGEMTRIPEQADILVCHQVWAEFMGEPCAPDGSLAELVPDHIKLVITGDFHHHTHSRLKNKNGSEFVVLSPGSATLQQIGEDPNKSLYLLQDDLTFDSLRLRNRAVFCSRVEKDSQVNAEIDRTLAAMREQEQVDQDLPPELRTPMWVVQLYDGLTDAPKRLAQAAKGKAHLFLRPFGDKDVEPVAEVSDGVDSSTFEGVLAQEVPPDSPVYSTAVRLWRAKDPKAELEAIIEEALQFSDEPKCPAPEAPRTDRRQVDLGPDDLFRVEAGATEG